MKPTKILRIDSSLFGTNGASNQLNDQLVEHLKGHAGDVQVIHRDLAAQPLPHVSMELMGALGKDPAERSNAETSAVATADTLIREVREADILVIGAPMYNFTIPSTLKAWMDHVARAGDTFKYTETGPVGLLQDTQVFITASRGGMHKGQVSDNVVPLLESFFSLLGLTDIEVIYAEGLNMGKNHREQAFEQAQQAINRTAA